MHGTTIKIIQNIVYIYVCCAFVGVDNKLYKMQGTYIKIVTKEITRSAICRHVTAGTLTQ